MKRRIIFIILACAVAGMIFWFSAQPATVSQSMSNGFIHMFLIRFLPDGITSGISTIVRKTAHFSEYALLGAFVFGAVTPKKPIFKVFCLSEIICMFYAATDEIHQHFVPGRGCRFFDVTVDSLGSAFGIAIMMLIFYLIYKKEKGTEV